MRLIIGGAHAGKRAYAAETYHIPTEEMADGALADPAKVPALPCVYNFHLLVRRLRQAGQDPAAYAQTLGATKLVVIMDETGCGVVPIQQDERLWREDVGRAGCVLARQAQSVERVACGLPIKLKG